MSEHNWIYKKNGELVGHFRHDVAWLTPDKVRIGEYDEEFVYDRNSKVVAKYSNNLVMNMVGEEIGRIDKGKIYVGDKQVGSYIGKKAAAAASIALIFNVDSSK